MRRLLPLALLPLVAGCGFTPMYAKAGLASGLASVEVEPPPHSRAGYLLHEQIDDALGRDRTEAARYRLGLTLTEQRFPLGVRINNVASRYEIDLNVVWVLKDAATGAEITRGAATGRTSYDSGDAPYSGVAAEQDGEERAASEAAVRVRYGLSRWFALHPPGSIAGGPPSARQAEQLRATLAPSITARSVQEVQSGQDGVPEATPPLETSPTPTGAAPGPK